MIIRLSLALLLAASLSACEQASNSAKTATANTDFSAYQGQWLFINYWASWCKPCIEEIPELNHFAQQQAGKAQVFAVNFDGLQGAALQQQAQKFAINYHVLEQDPAPSLNHAIPIALPTTYVYNPQGKLHKTLLGPQTIASLQAAMQ
ncbi:TlpA family protein disulfide reductase [Dasania sp. GY-MA-18]|uniref:TlpA disulfide reductase family protein n=1 Tax=Dasania phycosphaerae TaxID=2950436 RepID=A0A9J6RPV0_9GAMM|nr:MULTISPECIES: TlpA disulfide reductase family protein [Dasania]MCR8923944.1 TlpA family protein disulfide reductase [Dasania sp. GY-MA-18]MCZ0866378.1 TlpA disulfide reductase family protein [Dasania phycosphaerae]MCZ0870102.1 TlpA disulfide reductase family protein [Dasania phycosphaerae]